MNRISLNIKYLVYYERMSQDAFGELFGLKKSVIGNYIHGKSMPNIELLIKIANYYKITLDELVLKDIKPILEKTDTSFYVDADKIDDGFGNILQDSDLSYELENEVSKEFLTNLVAALHNKTILKLLKKKLKL